MIIGYLGVGLIIVLILMDCKRIKMLYREYKIQINAFFKRIWAFLRDWRNALCFGIAWIITNGWGWFFLIAGPIFGAKWMTRIGGAYIAFLWLPMVNEKVVTVALAVLIKKTLFRRKHESNETSSSKNDGEERIGLEERI